MKVTKGNVIEFLDISNDSYVDLLFAIETCVFNPMGLGPLHEKYHYFIFSVSVTYENHERKVVMSCVLK